MRFGCITSHCGSQHTASYLKVVLSKILLPGSSERDLEDFLRAFLTREGWRKCHVIDLVAGMVMNIGFVNLKSKLLTHQVHYALKMMWTVLHLSPEEIIQCCGILIFVKQRG